jgi:hypothetical protein
MFFDAATGAQFTPTGCDVAVCVGIQQETGLLLDTEHLAHAVGEGWDPTFGVYIDGPPDTVYIVLAYQSERVRQDSTNKAVLAGGSYLVENPVMRVLVKRATTREERQDMLDRMPVDAPAAENALTAWLVLDGAPEMALPLAEKLEGSGQLGTLAKVMDLPALRAAGLDDAQQSNIFRWVGQSHEANGDWVEALNCYSFAHESFPISEMAYARYTRLLQQQVEQANGGAFSEALVQELLREHPSFASSYTRITRALPEQLELAHQPELDLTEEQIENLTSGLEQTRDS